MLRVLAFSTIVAGALSLVTTEIVALALAALALVVAVPALVVSLRVSRSFRAEIERQTTTADQLASVTEAADSKIRDHHRAD